MDIASYDLHLHTCWSYDALAEPAEVLHRAHELGLRVLAITDHHVLDSLPEVLLAAADYPQLRVIPAAELSVATSLGAVDLVCLGFPRALPAAIQDVLDIYHQWQRDHGQGIVRGLRALGVEWTEQDHHQLLDSYRPPRTLAVQGYTHVKHEVQSDCFIRRGIVASQEEYRALMQRAVKAAALPSYPSVERVVPALKASGILISIAHPFGYFQGQDVGRMDALCQECGLDGIECAHPAVPAEMTPGYRRYCIEHGMVSTAGSDSHTSQQLQTLLGRHGGAQEWLDELLDRLSVAEDPTRRPA